jgi:predicted HicB family RNase H-like nuclease
MSKRMGRPKLPANKARNLTLRLRVSIEEKKRFKAAARRAGVSFPKWHRNTLNYAAGGRIS